MVYFIGAGPGAADLITVRGAELLKKADVIIYAGSLVNPALLDYAGKDCKIYNSASMTLEEVTDVMKENRDGLVVRLHTGDPCIYGAIREQMDILDEGLETFAGRIAVFHMKDFVVRDGAVKQVAPGRGMFDYPAILAKIKAYDPEAVLVLEGTTGPDIEPSIEFVRSVWNDA